MNSFVKDLLINRVNIIPMITIINLLVIFVNHDDKYQILTLAPLVVVFSLVAKDLGVVAVVMLMVMLILMLVVVVVVVVLLMLMVLMLMMVVNKV